MMFLLEHVIKNVAKRRLAMKTEKDIGVVASTNAFSLCWNIWLLAIFQTCVPRNISRYTMERTKKRM